MIHRSRYLIQMEIQLVDLSFAGFCLDLAVLSSGIISFLLVFVKDTSDLYDMCNSSIEQEVLIAECRVSMS